MSETHAEQPAIQDSGIEKDVHIELPFPLLVATFEGRFVIVARLVDNQFADIGIVDTSLPQEHAFCGKPIASVRVAFGPTPIGGNVTEHWTNAIGVSAQSLYNAFLKKLATAIVTPKKPALVGLNGGRVA